MDSQASIYDRNYVSEYKLGIIKSQFMTEIM
jgi:hypothetical protein